MSTLLYPETCQEWKASLHEVGYNGVVGAVMPTSYIQEHLTFDADAQSARLHDLASHVAHVALGSAFTELRYERKNADNWGMHLDISGENAYGSGVAELSFWVNEQGAAKWTLLDTGSRDTDQICATFEQVELQVPSTVAGSGLVFNPEHIADYAQVEFHGLGMLAFAAGLQMDGNRNPAIHQVETIASSVAPEPRISTAIYGRRAA